jgi:hypothetical protein
MKKVLAVIVLAMMVGCAWAGFQVRQKVNSWEVDEEKYVVASNTVAYISKLNPRIDPSIVKIIADRIDVECLEQGIPPEIVVALINRESGFKPWAVSVDKAGKPLAFGLMQINPRAHNFHSIAQNDLCRIDINIREGCRILKGYMGTSENIKQALGKYVGSGKFVSYQRDILSTSAELFAMN